MNDDAGLKRVHAILSAVEGKISESIFHEAVFAYRLNVAVTTGEAQKIVLKAMKDLKRSPKTGWLTNWHARLQKGLGVLDS